MDKQQLKLDLIRDEGIRDRAYYDTKGIMTIGVGFNLSRPEALPLFSMLGYDLSEIRQYGQKVDRADIFFLLDLDISSAEKDIRKVIKNFDQLSEKKQRALMNMLFNLGVTRFSRFKKMIKAIHEYDYTTASKEMLNSKWAKEDVPNRAERINNLWNS